NNNYIAFNTARNNITNQLFSLATNNIGINYTDTSTLSNNGNVGLDIEKNTLGNADLVVNQQGSGAIFSASASGIARFKLTNDGSIDVGDGNATNNGLSSTGIYLNGNLRM